MEVIKMAHRVYKMTAAAWDSGMDWDTAIYNGEIETVKEFGTYEGACAYFDNELCGDAEKYGAE